MASPRALFTSPFRRFAAWALGAGALLFAATRARNGWDQLTASLLPGAPALGAAWLTLTL